MFGVHPTQWLMRFSHPVITEILQISYSSYYFILFIVLCESYRRKNRDEFFTGGFLVLYGFYLSYIGYFVVPGVGPRFTLHDFGTLNSELPGLWLTSYIRDLLNAGESIPAGVTDAIRYVQRDVFPSGHTQLTLVSIYLAFKYRIVSRWIILVLGTLLIIATVYLRYHYVVDVIGGVIFFLFTIWSGTRIERWWKRQWM
jgi:membrane-associated phospholipid phosphatase